MFIPIPFSKMDSCKYQNCFITLLCSLEKKTLQTDKDKKKNLHLTTSLSCPLPAWENRLWLTQGMASFPVPKLCLSRFLNTSVKNIIFCYNPCTDIRFFHMHFPPLPPFSHFSFLFLTSYDTWFEIFSHFNTLLSYLYMSFLIHLLPTFLYNL